MINAGVAISGEFSLGINDCGRSVPPSSLSPFRPFRSTRADPSCDDLQVPQQRLPGHSARGHVPQRDEPVIPAERAKGLVRVLGGASASLFLPYLPLAGKMSG